MKTDNMTKITGTLHFLLQTDSRSFSLKISTEDNEQREEVKKKAARAAAEKLFEPKKLEN